MIECWNVDDYIYYCWNMVRCCFIDRYLYSVERDKMRTQARISYIFRRLRK